MHYALCIPIVKKRKTSIDLVKRPFYEHFLWRECPIEALYAYLLLYLVILKILRLVGHNVASKNYFINKKKMFLSIFGQNPEM